MKKIFFFLLFFPFLINAQNTSTWKLYNGCKKLLEGSAGEQKEIEIKKEKISKLTVKYFPKADRKNWNTTFIIMDTIRQEISRVPAKNNKMIIDKEIMSNYNSMIVYIVSKPNDPILASKIRVGTVPLFMIKTVE
jgi:hypothetical protein